MVDMPYFMTDDKWYYYDYDDKKYKLTDEAPEKAKESYVEFYKEVNYRYGKQNRRSDN